MPYDDTLLTFAFHIDNGMNVNSFIRLLETLYRNFHTIGNFLIIVQQNLFSDNFANKETSGLIRQLVFIEIGRRIGQ